MLCRMFVSERLNLFIGWSVLEIHISCTIMQSFDYIFQTNLNHGSIFYDVVIEVIFEPLQEMRIVKFKNSSNLLFNPTTFN